MATGLRNLKVHEVSLVKRGANKGARILVHKSLEESEMPNLSKFVAGLRSAFRVAATAQKPDGTVLKSDEEVLAELDEQVGAIEKTLSGNIEKDDGSDCDDDDDMLPGDKMNKSIAKATDMARRAHEAITKAEAEAKESRAVAKAAEERIAKIENERKHEVAVAKAKELLGDFPGDAEALAKVMEANPDAEKAIAPILTKAREAAAALTREIGKSGNRSPSVSETVVAKAADILKSDPKLTKEQAIRKALTADPALYEASLTK